MNSKCRFQGCNQLADFQCLCTSPNTLLCNSHLTIHIGTAPGIHSCTQIASKINNQSRVQVMEFLISEKKSLFSLKNDIIEQSSSLLKTFSDTTFNEISNIDTQLKKIQDLINDINKNSSQANHLMLLKGAPSQALLKYKEILAENFILSSIEEIIDSIFAPAIKDKYIKKEDYQSKILKYEDKLYNLEEKLNLSEYKYKNFENSTKRNIDNANANSELLKKEKIALNEQIKQLNQQIYQLNEQVKRAGTMRYQQNESRESIDDLKTTIKQLEETNEGLVSENRRLTKRLKDKAKNNRNPRRQEFVCDRCGLPVLDVSAGSNPSGIYGTGSFDIYRGRCNCPNPIYKTS